MLLNVVKFARVTLGVMGVRAVLSSVARIRQKKFAYFLNKKILYLCDIRNKAVAESALGTFVTSAFVVKLTPFFFICRGYQFMHFFLVRF